jgi:hypothetical protein
MKFVRIDPPRVFEVGRGAPIQLRDCARIELAPDEQVTFVTDAGAEYDVARKAWGFYATPSLNGRLPRCGLRAVLVKGPEQKFYLLLVECGKEADFQHYLDAEGHTIVCWLDSDEALTALERTLR